MRRMNGSQVNLGAVRWIVLAAIAVLAIVLVFSFLRTRHYTTLDAQVLSTNVSVDMGVDNRSKSTLIKTITCRYTVEGTDYEATYRTFFKNPDPDDRVRIACDPADPQQIRDPFLYEAGIVCILFLTAFVGLFTLSQRKNNGQ